LARATASALARARCRAELGLLGALVDLCRADLEAQAGGSEDLAAHIAA